MSGAVTDVRDVLGIEGLSEPRQPPVKKLKTVEKRPDGITRELYALLGENAPPVAVIEQRFKEKRRFYGKVTPWERREFKNSARDDSLLLKHWVRRSDNNDDDGNKPDEPLDSHFAKFNIQVDIVKYTDHEYDDVLKDPDWSKEETDYLFELLKEYDLRWVIVADRYEWGVTPEPDPEPEPVPTNLEPIVKEEKEDGMEGVEMAKPGVEGNGVNGSKSDNNNKKPEQPSEPEPPKKPQRTMEDLKARYYQVCRTLMEHRHPGGAMEPNELEYYNSLKYDKAKETERKRILKIQLGRTTEDLEKERNLIHELRRINDNHQQMLEEREDLFNRLDFPSTTGSIAAYTNSAGLAALAQTLMASDRSKKRKSIAAAASASGGAAAGATSGEAGAAASPTVQSHKDKDKDKDKEKDKEKEDEKPAKETAAATTTKSESKHHRNESISKADKDGGDHKSSTKDSKKKEKEKEKEPVVRTLTAAEEKIYNVSHHEKLQQGVWVRSQKMTLPKGHGYNPKYINLMTELDVPPALTMPTLRNCAKYEALCAEVGAHWDLRKAIEKVDHEIKVFEKQEAMAKADEGSGAPKRSASVMSDSSKAAKKPKKDK